MEGFKAFKRDDRLQSASYSQYIADNGVEADMEVAGSFPSEGAANTDYLESNVPHFSMLIKGII